MKAAIVYPLFLGEDTVNDTTSRANRHLFRQWDNHENRARKYGSFHFRRVTAALRFSLWSEAENTIIQTFRICPERTFSAAGRQHYRISG